MSELWWGHSPRISCLYGSCFHIPQVSLHKLTWVALIAKQNSEPEWTVTRESRILAINDLLEELIRRTKNQVSDLEALRVGGK